MTPPPGKIHINLYNFLRRAWNCLISCLHWSFRSWILFSDKAVLSGNVILIFSICFLNLADSFMKSMAIVKYEKAWGQHALIDLSRSKLSQRPHTCMLWVSAKLPIFPLMSLGDKLTQLKEWLSQTQLAWFDLHSSTWTPNLTFYLTIVMDLDKIAAELNKKLQNWQQH